MTVRDAKHATFTIERVYAATPARVFAAWANKDAKARFRLIAKNTMGWSTYLNTLQFDYDQFTSEFDEIAAHIREQQAAGVPA
jgi:hypothetical protein